MIAMLMRTNRLIFVFILIILRGHAQQSTCNNKTSSNYLQKYVPKGICIPKGKVIDRIYSVDDTVDFNKDGYSDLVFSYSKDANKLTDGDSSFLVFYAMNRDSTYTLFKQYNNILPVHFDPNQNPVHIRDKKLNKILECYETLAPLLYLDIKADSVVIMRYLATIEKKKYVFKFNSKLKDWELNEMWYLAGDHYVESFPVVPNFTLSNFSYCDN